MSTVNFKKTDLFHGPLILVNKEHPIMETYSNPSLTQVDPSYPHIQMEAKAASLLIKLMEELDCNGEIIPVSGYRNRVEQKRIYRDSVYENGLDFTRKYVALPGRSEHQSGLAIDLAWNKGVIDYIRPEFPYTGICGAFRELAVKYGFIERYGKGKEKITGISHEPWHFRYVGYPHSRIISDNQMCLEEYLSFIRDKHLRIKNGETEIEVFMLQGGEKKEINLPENSIVQVSGNNMDGLIITIWRRH